MGSRNLNRREHFRLSLPAGEELNATFGGTRYTITEISERGLRIRGRNIPNQDGICNGTIQWSDGIMTPITGRLARYEFGEQVIVCVKGIEMHHIVNEQRYMNRKQGLRVIGSFR